MTEPTRGVRQRRSNRRPGWVLLTVLLVLAIVASSALVFTNKVELLKLAVIIALWAAVVAAFISFIYRRQADIDQAKARDLKLVYDLQLDREISARREYELSVESQLRRELASELRAQSSDEIASLRAELAALRANLEILFDTDLAHRPALETERTAVHTFGRVISSRIDAEEQADEEPHTDESPIIDVPAEPDPPEYEWALSRDEGGAHRRASDRASAAWRPAEPPPPAPRAPEQPREAELRFPWLPPEPPPASTPAPRPAPVPPPAPAPAPKPEPEPAPTPAPPVSTPPAPPVSTPPAAASTPPASPWREPERPGRHTQPGAAPGWQPAPAEGLFIPAGHPGSNWQSPAAENGIGTPSVPPTKPEPEASEPVASAPPVEPPAPSTPPAMTPPPTEGRRGRHTPAETNGDDAPRRARHYAPGADPGRPAPTLATPSSTPAGPPPEDAPSARHRGAEETPPVDAGQHAGGQPLSELLARLQVSQSEGGRRRRRED
ncbi:DUF6779 domain-containing protein [Mycolicibacterium arenosum]|uniref:DUF6779 domain-containing protein n=1 Tax=Mycolicibacterium arenosum TaxID=2952157 RepID=A0ABT1MB38_9MYCO|nr:DUF6779 domain-containing protein [Mycolicibacterium sp. CAU 1645]MCP9275597.1 hypothetical protein [Mycolicibacterium sp. CAU 1645]